MMPFRRVEHWLWDLYLIDQQVQKGKNVPILLRGIRACRHDSISEHIFIQKKGGKNKPVLFNYTDQRTKIKGLCSLRDVY